jgi:hypothetical protein
MTSIIWLVPSAAKSFCDRGFYVPASNWIGVQILASERDRASDQQVDPSLEALSPLEPLTQTAEHPTLPLDYHKQTKEVRWLPICETGCG